MTAATAPNEGAAPKTTEAVATAKVPTSGWLVIARKEFGDHVVSIRFVVLLIVLGLAVAIPLYFAADRIRSLATAAVTAQESGQLAIFLALFTVGPQDIALLRVDTFVSIVAPLLGLAFAFDAVNGERSEGTLPRLLAQPIYRDDVINGKFAAGLAVIGVVLVSVVLFITGFGMLRLALVPHGQEVVRLVAWLIATFLYVSVWLAFGLLLSVAIRRAATSALIGFGVWLLLTIFGPLIVSLVSGVFSPVGRGDRRGAAQLHPDPGPDPATAAEQSLQRDLDRDPPAQRHDHRGPGQPRPVRAGAAADPRPPDARPEPAARVAADRRARGPDRDLLRGGLRAVHAPGGPRLARPPEGSTSSRADSVWSPLAGARMLAGVRTGVWLRRRGHEVDR